LTADGLAVDSGEPALRTLAVATAAILFLQILLGAIVRHTGAGLAIPTFPLAYGRLVPPLGNLPVALHFAHRIGALVVAGAVGWTAVRAWHRHRDDRWLLRPALALPVLVVLQVALGGWVVLSAKTAWIATAHLGVGALMWGTALLLALRTGRGLRLAPRAAGTEPLPLLVLR
jgi:cytochrome c oxidase assembly protein subunit 15